MWSVSFGLVQAESIVNWELEVKRLVENAIPLSNVTPWQCLSRMTMLYSELYMLARISNDVTWSSCCAIFMPCLHLNTPLLACVCVYNHIATGYVHPNVRMVIVQSYHVIVQSTLVLWIRSLHHISHIRWLKLTLHHHVETLHNVWYIRSIGACCYQGSFLFEW